MFIVVTILAVSIVMAVLETRDILAANICGAITTGRHCTEHRYHNDSCRRNHSYSHFTELDLQKLSCLPKVVKSRKLASPRG